MKFGFLKLRETRGMSVVGLIAVLLLFAGLSYALVYLIEEKQMAFPTAYHSSKAFQIAEGGIQYTAKYLKGYSDWSSVPDIETTQLGGGVLQSLFKGDRLILYPPPLWADTAIRNESYL